MGAWHHGPFVTDHGVKVFYAFATPDEDEPSGVECIAQYGSPKELENWLAEMKAKAIRDGDDSEGWDGLRLFRVTMEEIGTASASRAAAGRAGGKEKMKHRARRLAALHSWHLEAEPHPTTGYRRMLCSKCGIWMRDAKIGLCPGKRPKA